MLPDYILLLIVSALPILYKYSFWLYAIQLKEYRWDRFKEYLTTPQWFSAIFSFWFLIELPLIIATSTIFFDPMFEIIIYPVIFYFLIIQNIFVIWKMIRKKIIKPKMTSRLLITVFILWIGIIGTIYYILLWTHYKLTYIYIFSSLLISPIIIFIAILITLPLVHFLKNRRIKRAINKSKNTTKPVKIWITGSYGKSSIKEFLGSILEKEWNTLKTPENNNTEMSVSALINNKLNNTYDYFVAEMWAYKRGEIQTLGKIVNHKHWFLTSVGTQHIGLFWNIENTKTAKAEIAEKVLKNEWNLYINRENEHIRKIKFNKKLNTVKYWNHKWSDTKYKIIKTNLSETQFELEYKKKKYTFKTNIIWEHNILNISWVIACCLDLWIEEKNIKKHLTSLTSPKNTLEIIKTKNYTLINDSYNLPENGLLAALKVLNTLEGEKILIMDDIFELWKKSEEIHKNLWKKIAQEKSIDKVCYIWKNFKKHFTKWLKEWWLKELDIIQSLDTLKKGSIILFEWRNSKKYFDKLIKNV
jgi:UDP-N-acetylmuramoyl-tripeptide--D-alanyl-D-alanine ligase